MSIASVLKLQSFTKMLQRFLKLFNGDTPLMATRNPAIKPVEVGSLPHDLKGFIHPVRWLAGFLNHQQYIGRDSVWMHDGWVEGNVC